MWPETAVAYGGIFRTEIARPGQNYVCDERHNIAEFIGAILLNLTVEFEQGYRFA